MQLSTGELKYHISVYFVQLYHIAVTGNRDVIPARKTRSGGDWRPPFFVLYCGTSRLFRERSKKGHNVFRDCLCACSIFQFNISFPFFCFAKRNKRRPSIDIQPDGGNSILQQECKVNSASES